MVNIKSKAGIVLLSPVMLKRLICYIQDCMPGYWWSISQQPERLTISVCPTRACPNPLDVLFSQTSRGDKGFIYTMNHLEHDHESQVFSFLETIADQVNYYVRSIRDTHPNIDNVVIASSYRKQSENDLRNLQGEYIRLMTDLTLFEQSGHTLSEIYLGSCEFSVDCSLRGHRDDKSEFDISVDFTEDTILAESLNTTICELANDILTHKNQTTTDVCDASLSISRNMC